MVDGVGRRIGILCRVLGFVDWIVFVSFALRGVLGWGGGGVGIHLEKCTIGWSPLGE